MANIHGAIAVCEKRILTKWGKLADNRLELEKICAAAEQAGVKKADAEKAGGGEAQLVSDKLNRVNQLLDENRTLLQEIERQYLALFKIRNR